MDKLPYRDFIKAWADGKPYTATRRTNRSEGELRAIHRDNAGHFSRELAFVLWLDSTVYGQAVRRWVADIGARP